MFRFDWFVITIEMYERSVLSMMLFDIVIDAVINGILNSLLSRICFHIFFCNGS